MHFWPILGTPSGHRSKHISSKPSTNRQTQKRKEKQRQQRRVRKKTMAPSWKGCWRASFWTNIKKIKKFRRGPDQNCTRSSACSPTSSAALQFAKVERLPTRGRRYGALVWRPLSLLTTSVRRLQGVSRRTLTSNDLQNDL